MVSAFSRRAKWLRLFRLKPTQVIILSFVFMILLGTLLLMLPISTYDGNGVPAIDALFVSTSASCVVGLTVVDLKNELTFFGKLVMLLLIQVGGLGIMTLATLVVHSMGYRFQLSENLILQESLNQKTQAGIVQLIKRMIKYTFIIEGFFAVLLAVLICIVWIIIQKSTMKNGRYADIRISGVSAARLDLDNETKKQFHGENDIDLTVVTGNGCVYVEKSECPDKICVKTGKISAVGEQIVCLPARIVIEVKN